MVKNRAVGAGGSDITQWALGREAVYGRNADCSLVTYLHHHLQHQLVKDIDDTSMVRLIMKLIRYKNLCALPFSYIVTAALPCNAHHFALEYNFKKSLLFILIITIDNIYYLLYFLRM